MASLKQLIFGSLIFLTMTTGMFSIYGIYYINQNIPNPLGTTTLNTTVFNATNNYLSNWANQTATSLSNAQAIPFFGGSFMLLTGVFQSLTLLTSIPTAVMIPLLNTITNVLPIPWWMAAFIFIGTLIIFIFALLRAMGAGGAG